jgi:hypothetical protein
MSAEKVSDFVRERMKVNAVGCTQLKTKHTTYSSVCLEVLMSDFRTVYYSDEWPTGLLLKPFRGNPGTGERARNHEDSPASPKNA